MVQHSLAPWLSVPDGPRALAFYKAAFDAVEVYRLGEDAGGLVARLSAQGAEFWISAEEFSEASAADRPSLGGGTVRMILTVADPDVTYAAALAAGASSVFAVGEDHGWRLGRIVDPFGLHWEIGRPV